MGYVQNRVEEWVDVPQDRCPQGLKPSRVGHSSGTAEAVPCPNLKTATGSEDTARRMRSVDFHTASDVAVSIELSDNGYVGRLCNRVLELHH
jgi:hypothetical protein